MIAGKRNTCKYFDACVATLYLFYANIVNKLLIILIIIIIIGYSKGSVRGRFLVLRERALPPRHFEGLS